MTIEKNAFFYESQWTVQFRRGNTAVVRVSGELDVARAEELRELLVTDEVLGAPAVRVDLTQSTFLDSSCISVLVLACKRVRASGGAFSLVVGQSVCRRVLAVTGLLEFFEVEDHAKGVVQGTERGFRLLIAPELPDAG